MMTMILPMTMVTKNALVDCCVLPVSKIAIDYNFIEKVAEAELKIG
jgi:hypothetical protein